MLKNLLSAAFARPKRQPAPAVATPASADRDRTVVFTTVHAEGFAKYGRGFVSSFLSYWPQNYELWIYGEGFEFEPPPRVRFFDLDATIPALAAFKRRHALTPVAKGRLGANYNYRFDAVRFANKAFVMADVHRKLPARFALWLDADTVTFQGIPADLVERLLPDGEFMAYLGRMGMHSETGFVPFDLTHPGAARFFEALEAMYLTDTVFSLAEWHDCQVVDTVRGYLQATGTLQARNLNTFGTAHPFVNSAAGLFMDHLKGPQRKDAQHSGSGDFVIPPYTRVNFTGGRYGQLPPLLAQLTPTSITEVGTWSGWRGIQMALASLRAGKPVHYRGFDVFEVFSAEFDAREMNVKPHFSKQEVERLLSLLAQIYPEFTFELIQGDTNETLRDERSEFVFLDGGHSVATIAHDFAAVRQSQVIVLDDYYSGPIDTAQYGCNEVLRGERAWLMPQRDPVAGGGFTQFAITCGDGVTPFWDGQWARAV